MLLPLVYPSLYDDPHSFAVTRAAVQLYGVAVAAEEVGLAFSGTYPWYTSHCMVILVLLQEQLLLLSSHVG